MTYIPKCRCKTKTISSKTYIVKMCAACKNEFKKTQVYGCVN